MSDGERLPFLGVTIKPRLDRLEDLLREPAGLRLMDEEQVPSDARRP